MKRPRLTPIWLAVLALATAPALAADDCVVIEDFAAAALLLGGAGLALEAVLRFVRGTGARLGLGLAIGVALMLVWAELAVGLFH